MERHGEPGLHMRHHDYARPKPDRRDTPAGSAVRTHLTANAPPGCRPEWYRPRH